MERFRSGTTRIIVASDCFTWGVDVPDIRQVIMFDLPSSFSKLVQQLGRAGRDKQQAYAITYAPSWVEDIVKDLEEPLKKHKVADLKRREEMCQTLRAWFNPTEDSCPREVFCIHFGDELSRPENCCITHNKVLPDTKPEPSRIDAFASKRTKGLAVRSDGTYTPFEKKDRLLQDAISNMISTWVRNAWNEVHEQNSLLPPTSFLSQEFQDRLRDRFHTITRVENLSTLLAGWPLLEQYKTRLLSFCQEALNGLEEVRKGMKEMEEKCEADKERPVKIRIRPLVTSASSSEIEDGLPPRKRRRRESGMVM